LGAKGAPWELNGFAPRFSRRRYALVVGISEYEDSNFPELRHAERDAEAVAEFLRSDTAGTQSPDDVILLTKGDATRTKILVNLLDLLAKANADDMVLLYFSCHGWRQSTEKSAPHYLVPSDADFKKPEVSQISRDEIRRHLDAADVQRQLIFLDCCFAGEVRTNSAAEPWDFSNGQRAVFTSTAANEVAPDRSAFARSLLAALRGGASDADGNGDGVLLTGELHDYLLEEVPSAAVPFHMHPQLYGSRDLPVAWERR